VPTSRRPFTQIFEPPSVFCPHGSRGRLKVGVLLAEPRMDPVAFALIVNRNISQRLGDIPLDLRNRS
jgi:hypothetical protein